MALKSYLGLALTATIEEMQMQKRAQKIYEVYLETFKEIYNKFKKDQTDSSKLDGKLVEHYEYPIGSEDKLQYYQAYGTMIFSNLRRVEYLKSESNGLLEGYSTNEGAKSQKNSKNRRPRARSEMPRKRRTR